MISLQEFEDRLEKALEEDETPLFDLKDGNGKIFVVKKWVHDYIICIYNKQHTKLFGSTLNGLPPAQCSPAIQNVLINFSVDNYSDSKYRWVTLTTNFLTDLPTELTINEIVVSLKKNYNGTNH